MEETTLYPEQTTIVNRSLTMEIRHVAMVYSLIEQGVGKSFSAVIRDAIEAYYKKCQEAK